MNAAAASLEEDDMILQDKPSLVIEERTKCNIKFNPFSISYYVQLQELIICDRIYLGNNECTISNNANLRTLIVKNKCFYEGCCNPNSKGSLCISNCCSLKVIEIGDSFCNFKSFCLKGMLVDPL